MTRPKAKGYRNGILPPRRETWKWLYKSKRGTVLEISEAGRKHLSLIVRPTTVTASQPIIIRHAGLHVEYGHISRNVYFWTISAMRMLSDQRRFDSIRSSLIHSTNYCHNKRREYIRNKDSTISVIWYLPWELPSTPRKLVHVARVHLCARAGDHSVGIWPSGLGAGAFIGRIKLLLRLT